MPLLHQIITGLTYWKLLPDCATVAAPHLKINDSSLPQKITSRTNFGMCCYNTKTPSYFSCIYCHSSSEQFNF